MTAEDNRKRMPNVARMVDEVRAVFGAGVKVIYAREGDYELGTRPDPAKYVVPCFDETPEQKPTTKRRR